MSEKTFNPNNLKLISLGDYVKDLDYTVIFPIKHKGEDFGIELRIIKPMADFSHKVMEAASELIGDDISGSQGEEFDFLSAEPEQRKSYNSIWSK